MLKTPIARIGDVIVARSESKQYDAFQGTVSAADLKDDLWTYTLKTGGKVKESDIIGVYSTTRQYFQAPQN